MHLLSFLGLPSVQKILTTAHLWDSGTTEPLSSGNKRLTPMSLERVTLKCQLWKEIFGSFALALDLQFIKSSCLLNIFIWIPINALNSVYQIRNSSSSPLNSPICPRQKSGAVLHFLSWQSPPPSNLHHIHQLPLRTVHSSPSLCLVLWFKPLLILTSNLSIKCQSNHFTLSSKLFKGSQLLK